MALTGDADAWAPRAPSVTWNTLVKQFCADVYGKEVQDPATYSYMWIADQSGHIFIGVLVQCLASLAFKLLLFVLTAWLSLQVPEGVAYFVYAWGSVLLAAIVVSSWERSAYRSAVSDATGLFPLDRKLLRENATVAAYYMILGVAVGGLFHIIDNGWWQALGLAIVILLGFAPIPRWLRQKIIWQRASLPYLYRLADMQHTLGVNKARELQALIDAQAPPVAVPRQIVISGPIDSGRTDIAAGIGTEFAFKDTMVRYLNLGTLLEFAAQQPVGDDTGPPNLDYWHWFEAQVIIIDDIGPLIAVHRDAGKGSVDRFYEMLDTGLKPILEMLGQRHTVWVFGDLRTGDDGGVRSDALKAIAARIAKRCNAREDALVVELTQQRCERPRKASQVIVPENGAEISHVAPEE